jgi:hypothetical protein
VIPAGFYNATQLTEYLDKTVPFVDGSGNVLSFGSNVIDGVTGDYTYPAFDQDPYSYKYYLSQYNQLLQQTGVTINANPHIYQKWEWVFDAETLGFNQLIGYLPNKAIISLNSYVNPYIYVTNDGGIQSGSYTGIWNYQVHLPPGAPTLSILGVNDPSIPVPTQAVYPALLLGDMQPIKSLYFRLEEYTSEIRAPWQTLSRSDVLAVIPVTGQYGELIDYEVQNYIPAFNHDFRSNSLTVYITDDSGQLVDFQGVNWNASIVISFATDETRIPVDQTTRPPFGVANNAMLQKAQSSGIKPSSSLLSPLAPSMAPRKRLMLGNH